MALEQLEMLISLPPTGWPWRKGSAKDRIAQLLVDCYPEAVPVHRIQAITAKYTQRIRNSGEMGDWFKGRGWEVVNEQEGNRSWYRLQPINYWRPMR